MTITWLVVLFFNLPFLAIMLIPVINWLMYGVLIILNCFFEMFLHIQYTALIVFGWATWIAVIPAFAGAMLIWFLLQWYEKFTYICIVLFPGIFLLIWLIPLFTSLAISGLINREEEGSINNVWVIAIIAMIFKPTGIHLFFVFFRIAKDTYYKTSTGAGNPDTVDKVTRKDIAIFIFKTGYQFYDLITDFVVWQEGKYELVLEPIFGFCSVCGVFVTVWYVIFFALWTF